jgi:hypothetical protein
MTEHQERNEGAICVDCGHHGVMAIESTPASEPAGGSRAPERFGRGEGAANMVKGL